MCGLAFWFAKPESKWRPSKEMISSIVTELEMRGRDATGMATLRKEKDISVYKGALPAREWVESFKNDEVSIGPVGVLHTRGANVGSPEFNYNNHPLAYSAQNKPGVVIVHNGTIGNLDKCYSELGVKQHADVDSALIAASLGVLGFREGLQFLTKHSGGTGAIAAFNEEGWFAVARDSSPMWLGIPESGVLVGASTVEAIKKFCIDGEFGVDVFRIGELPNLTYSIWRPSGELFDQGRFMLPGGVQFPPFFRDRGINTPHRPTNSWEANEAAKAEREARAKEAREKREAVDGALACGFQPREPGRNSTDPDRFPKLPLDGERDIDGAKHYITCHWRGCWNKSRVVIPVDDRQVSLCGIHLDKSRKKEGVLVLSPAGELNRKMERDVDKEEELGATA